MLKELLISATVIAGFASAASAQTCATPPSCASLGYTLTAPKGDGWVCTGCPFDPTKFACTAKPCPAGTDRLRETVCYGNSTNYSLDITKRNNSDNILLNYLNINKPSRNDYDTLKYPTPCCVAGYSGDLPCYKAPVFISTTYYASGSKDYLFPFCE